MSNLISRSAAIEALDQHSYENGSDYAKTVELLNELPAVDAAPVVHARWEYLIGDYFCTNCDKKLRRSSRTKRPKYCERCGARMDGEAE